MLNEVSEEPLEIELRILSGGQFLVHNLPPPFAEPPKEFNPGCKRILMSAGRLIRDFNLNLLK